MQDFLNEVVTIYGFELLYSILKPFDFETNKGNILPDDEIQEDEIEEV